MIDHINNIERTSPTTGARLANTDTPSGRSRLATQPAAPNQSLHRAADLQRPNSQKSISQRSVSVSPAAGLASSKLPQRGGICLKPQHYTDILQQLPDVGWFEIHAENYLGAGGPPLHYLEEIRSHYPLSIHGVGMSIGSAGGLDENHLKRVSALVKRFEPESFSEHLAWSTHEDEFHSDLLPVPYNQSVEDTVCNHIDKVQSTLQRQLLLENPSNYLTLESSTIDEPTFLRNVVRRTGCGLLLDVNNVYVSAVNCNYSAQQYISRLGMDNVGEIHLAGHSVDDSDPAEILLIDAHDREVAEQVWLLFQYALTLGGNRPSLIEWDNSVPELSTLLSEMEKADRLAENRVSQPGCELT